MDGWLMAQLHGDPNHLGGGHNPTDHVFVWQSNTRGHKRDLCPSQKRIWDERGASLLHMQSEQRQSKKRWSLKVQWERRPLEVGKQAHTNTWHCQGHGCIQTGTRTMWSHQRSPKGGLKNCT